MEFRKGEGKATYFRSERLQVIDGQYYIATREGEDLGPFGTRVEAERGLARFIEAIQDHDNYRLAKSAALNGAWATNNFR
ncbi:hypothetical protein A3762_04355 [Oleiphilus sp. HI0125]|uniref:DUF6316 family protein n=1 Tax=Oleiphilus sp. HI0125 TaxID=1822266 RepID=UPI0007C3416C|nr:DUF6316 family protein [Oleiphilus sp. HI0125]KZZ59730.1 hypothetical protein A3762_04355 [Oleiphilus sp. HI0125]